MSLNLDHLEPGPLGQATIQTIQCECGWEAVWAVPEENQRLILAVFHHIQSHHQIALPLLTITSH